MTHQNVEKSLADWSKNRARLNLPPLPQRHYTEHVSALLCDDPQIPCYEGNCPRCSVEKIKDLALESELDEESQLKYSWEIFGKNEKGFPEMKVKVIMSKKP